MKYIKRGKSCSVEGCASPVTAKNLCNKHYRRLIRHGTTEPLRAPQGSKTPHINKANGRRYVWHNGKWRFEHRVVMEKHLGHPIPDGYHVHHKDGDRLNNAIENLELLEAKEHNSMHEREKARQACGHSHWRQCHICHQWDDPSNLYIWSDGKGSATVYHLSCRRDQYHLKRYGSLENKKEYVPRQPKKGQTCSEKGCSRPVRARGLCGSHYNRFMRFKT